MGKGLHFVKADMNYINVVFEWANDEITRQNAFNTNQIPYEEHVKWYKKKIVETDTLFYICMQDDISVGQLRVELDGNKAVISYSVDKKHRGKGYGKKIIRYAGEIVRQYCNTMSKKIELVGKVKLSNTASQRCFLAEGYKKNILNDYIEFTKIVS